MMNIGQKSALTLTVLMLTSLNISSCDVDLPIGQDDTYDLAYLLDSVKDNAKLAAWLANALAISYYFLHYPENRPSKAPIENVLRGKWEHPLNDIFNWDNVTNFSDIIPGQRWKIYSVILDARSMFKVKLLTDPNRTSIKGFGLYHFCEKNMRKLVKLTCALGLSYGLLNGQLEQTMGSLLKVILDAYGNAKTVGTNLAF